MNYKQAYSHQKSQALIRGIDFLLTFEEWFKIWTDSGHLHERGRKKNQYCMARFGDVGPYSEDNVKIILHSENASERLVSESQKNKHSVVMSGRCHTEEHNEKIGRSMSGKFCSDERKRNIAKRARERWSAFGRSVLTLPDIKIIRESKDRTCILADKFGVTQNTILNVRSGKTWRVGL